MRDLVAEAQQMLGHTVSRAQAEEDRALARQVRSEGAGLASSLNGLFRMARTHALDNQAFDQPVIDFSDRLGHLIDLLGPVHVVCVEEQVYVNDLRVRFDALVEQSVNLGPEFGRHRVGGISFNHPLDGAQIRLFIKLFTAPPAPVQPRRTLEEALLAAGLSGVELQPIQQFSISGGDAEEVLQEFADLYRASAGVVAEVFAAAGSDRLPNPLPARRVVTRFIDALEGEELLEQAVVLEDELPPVVRHTLMVTVLGLRVGREIGLSRPALADLGVTAMFHDAGFCYTSGGAQQSYAHHTRAAVPVLLRQRGFYPARLRRLLAILEHHEPFARTGGPPSLFSRILHIVDDFDILTRRRVEQRPLASPPDAVARMAGRAGQDYDPDLFQLFVNAVGPLPPTTRLRLEDGRMVQVISGVRTPATWATPRCRVLRRADGNRPPHPEFLDLAHGPRPTAVL